MGNKIDYKKIKWNAATNWDFCGTHENLKVVWDRCWDCLGYRMGIEEFGYSKPRKGLAFAKGDVVRYTPKDGVAVYAVVDKPVSIDNGYTVIKTADGSVARVHPDDIPASLEIARIPEELIALARAEAGKPIDLSKCPLKNPGACMEAR